MVGAPLPPHERSWRHPSELGPTAATVEPSSRRSRALALSSGAVAAVLVAVIVISITPRRSSAPSAISATTTPPASAQARPQAPAPSSAAAEPIGAAPVEAPADDVVRLGSRNPTAGLPNAALMGAPNAISAAPVAGPAELSPADTRPDPDDLVLVITAAFTYEVSWSVVADLWAPEDAIVITPTGDLLATFNELGRLVLLD